MPIASDSRATSVIVAISPTVSPRRPGANSSAVRGGATTAVGAAAALEVIPR